MTIAALNHFTVLTDDVPRTVRFYSDRLVLVEGSRPALGFPGAWLYVGERSVLHVVGGRSRAELKPGVIDHMAFSAGGLAQTPATLTAQGVSHTCRQEL